MCTVLAHRLWHRGHGRGPRRGQTERRARILFSWAAEACGWPPNPDPPGAVWSKAHPHRGWHRPQRGSSNPPFPPCITCRLCTSASSPPPPDLPPPITLTTRRRTKRRSVCVWRPVFGCGPKALAHPSFPPPPTGVTSAHNNKTRRSLAHICDAKWYVGFFPNFSPPRRPGLGVLGWGEGGMPYVLMFGRGPAGWCNVVRVAVCAHVCAVGLVGLGWRMNVVK